MALPTSPLPHDLRAALGHFATGVCVLTATDAAGAPVGTTVSALSSLSLDPPLLLACLDRDSETLAVVREGGRFAVNILAAEQQALSSHFARRGAAAGWDDVAHRPGASGSPRLDGALAVIDCEVHEHLEGGDHEIVLGRPLEIELASDRLPLLHFRGAYGALAA